MLRDAVVLQPVQKGSLSGVVEAQKQKFHTLVRKTVSRFPTMPLTGERVQDMGGCEIDLDGGEYRISKPLVLPEMNANMQFGHGVAVGESSVILLTSPLHRD